MHCPFCLEQIQDEAIACKHCGRSLDFFLPVERRITQLSGDVLLLRNELTGISNRLADLAPNALVPRPSLRRIALAVLWTIVIGGCFNALFWLVDSPLDAGMLAIATLTPGFVGGWLGFRHAAPFPSSFTMIGAMASLGLVSTVAAVDRSFQPLIPLPDAASVFGGTVIYTIIFLIGTSLGRRISTRRVARRMVLRVLPPGLRDANWTKKAGALLTTVAPLLTLVGTLGAAYLGRDVQADKTKPVIDKRPQFERQLEDVRSSAENFQGAIETSDGEVLSSGTRVTIEGVGEGDAYYERELFPLVGKAATVADELRQNSDDSWRGALLLDAPLFAEDDGRYYFRSVFVTAEDN